MQEVKSTPLSSANIEPTVYLIHGEDTLDNAFLELVILSLIHCALYRSSNYIRSWLSSHLISELCWLLTVSEQRRRVLVFKNLDAQGVP